MDFPSLLPFGGTAHSPFWTPSPVHVIYMCDGLVFNYRPLLHNLIQFCWHNNSLPQHWLFPLCPDLSFSLGGHKLRPMHIWGKNSATELYPELSSTLFCNYDSYLELGIVFVLSVLIQCVQVEVVIAPNLLLSCFLLQRKSASSYFAWPKAEWGHCRLSLDSLSCLLPRSGPVYFLLLLPGIAHLCPKPAPWEYASILRCLDCITYFPTTTLSQVLICSWIYHSILRRS